MASIVPPLDFIPKLPGKGVELLTAQLDTLLDQLLEKVSTTIQDTIKLPGDCKCDDPRIKKIKAQLAQIQEQITKVQESIPKIQETIETVKTIVSTAQAIKATISAAQLSNPVTAPLFIAQQLTAIQDATIVNALASLQQFSTLPNTLTSKLSVLVPPLLGALSKVSSACDGNVDNLELPDSVVSKLSASFNYNDAISFSNLHYQISNVKTNLIKVKPKNKTSWDEKAIYAVCIITASYFFIRIITLLIFNL